MGGGGPVRAMGNLYDLVPKEVMEKQDAQPLASDEQLATVAQDLRRYLSTHV